MMRATQQSMLKNLKFEGQANEILLSQRDYKIYSFKVVLWSALNTRC